MHLARGSQAVAYREVATRSGRGFVTVEYNRKNRWDLLVFVFTLIFLPYLQVYFTIRIWTTPTRRHFIRSILRMEG